MKIFPVILSIFLMSISHVCLSQMAFMKAYGDSNNIDVGLRVLQNQAGDYLILAGTNDNGGNGDTDFYLIKTDPSGSLIWTKEYGGIFPDYGNSFQQTTDGGYILAGTRNENTSQTNYHAYLIKTDANGDMLWTKSYGGGSQKVSCNSVIQTSNGGYALACNRYVGFLDDDINIIKTDALGNVIWSNNYGEPSPNVEYVNIIRETSDGGYILVGDRFVQFLTTRELFMIKLDSSGAISWSKTYGGSDAEFAADIQQSNDGGYIVTGRTISFGAGSNDIYLLKTDSSGNSLWSKTYGGQSDDRSYSVIQTTDGGYMLSAVTAPLTFGCYLIKTNNMGDTLWTRNFTNVGYAYDVKQTTDGGYIVPTHSYNYDALLIKADSNGYSSCNNVSVPNIVSAQTTVVSSTATLVTNVPITVSIQPTTVSSSGILTTICSTVGISEASSDNSFEVFPNPSSGNFTVSFEKTAVKANLEIFNIFGECVYKEFIFNESSKEFNLKNLSQGIYIIRVIYGEKSFCKKLFIEHN